ncbi:MULTISPECIES: glutamate--cysteine ligase [Streptomyces]|uniref:Putative glutamate--cysteine ligase 2 n=1 Tax=Streptomyces bugieae TaxID=3098223 RepID=A0ABU7NLP0_9ACTN|nr:glutamate--cysteine ligase [Streptomyces nigrescens]MEE4419125.1 glutamate--cysteine ligase [Streptomyces sp. DSM 41528]
MESEADRPAKANRHLPVPVGRGRPPTAAAAASPLTLGVEEEYLLVDPVTREVSPQAQKVVAQASSAGLGDRVGTELTCYQVEARTEPHTVVRELGEQIRSMRAVVADAAGRQGLRLVSSGAPVLGQSVPPPITEGPRYAQSVATFRALDDEQTACACHIHVGIADLGRALQVSNHLRPWVPTLISLMANSPYWSGRDTGYASWRVMTLARWPISGPPPYFESPAHFDDLVGRAIEVGAVMDRGGLYWDIRPSSHVPTLEVRVADAAATADETVLFSAIVRAMVATALKAVDAGEPAPRPRPELLRAACWRAARDGLSGQSVDLPTSHLVPAGARVDRLLTWIRPALRAYGDLGLVRFGWSRLRAVGNGADRQRLAHQRRRSLPDVVDHLIAAASPPPAYR